jgi:hypothetical protein
MMAMMVLSHAGNGAGTQSCTSRGKVAQPPSIEHRCVVAS